MSTSFQLSPISCTHCCLLPRAYCLADHPVRLHQHPLGNRQVDLLCRLEIDHELKLVDRFMRRSPSLGFIDAKIPPC